jgi:ABC-2 type transport system ATP-binding protein
MDCAIETAKLTRRYGRLDAVDSLDLCVPVGSTFALVGPNGAGKTTTLTMLMNLVRPSSGRATVLGVDSRRLSSRDFARIGYVSENQRLPDWMTTRALLAYCRPFYPAWDEALAGALLERFRLAPDAKLSTLSRGGRMKAALLTALAFRPALLVLDEPFSGLDPLVRDELTEALLDLGAEHPFTILVSSHDLDEVERLADWIGYLDEGRLRIAEPVSALRARFRRGAGSSDDGSAAAPLSLREIFLVLAGSNARGGEAANERRS